MTMNKLPEKFSLKDDFPITTYEEWKAVVEKDLKGVPFEKKLITRTYEGIDLQPIYNDFDIEDLPFTSEKPGFLNYLRGSNASGYINNSWKLTQEIFTNDLTEFNKALIGDLDNGLNAIYIHSELKIEKSSDFEIIFRNIDITKFPIYFAPQFSSISYLSLFVSYLKSVNINPANITGSLSVDPLYCLSVKGELPVDLDYLYDEMAEVIKWTDSHLPNMKVICVNATGYHNSGANAVQELSYALSTAVEYIEQMLDRDIAADIIAKNIGFTFGVSSFFFMEISKLRAARILWAIILSEYKVKEENAKMDIEAVTSFYNQTLFDPYVNILRTTTEAFSSIVGGADKIRTNPFDESFRPANDFSRRIARNTQNILKYESHLNRTLDPAGGSYYVEKLTSLIADKVWNEFINIQSKGGILNCLTDETIQKEIEKIHQLRLKDFCKRKNVLVGVNMYANVKEELLPVNTISVVDRTKEINSHKSSRDNDKLKAAFLKLPKGINIDAAIECSDLGALKNEIEETSWNIHSIPSLKITPLKKHRLAENFEQIRNKIYNLKKTPSIFLATMGPVKQHKARADFARGFFEVAGFNVIYNKGYESVDDAADEAIKSGAIAAVICSTDDTYPEIVPEFAKKVKDKLVIILAGYPKEQIESHKANGVDEFIYVGADAYSILNNLVELATKGEKK